MGLGTDNIPITIPNNGFSKIIRVGYWINADNPIGSATVVTPDLYYTASVGYGPRSNGVTINYSKTARIHRPSKLITLADGVYAGRQTATRLGVANSRIGYRHPNKTVNCAFAEGHVETLYSPQFPRAAGSGVTVAEAQLDNAPTNPTVYANPERALGP